MQTKAALIGLELHDGISLEELYKQSEDIMAWLRIPTPRDPTATAFKTKLAWFVSLADRNNWADEV